MDFFLLQRRRGFKHFFFFLRLNLIEEKGNRRFCAIVEPWEIGMLREKSDRSCKTDVLSHKVGDLFSFLWVRDEEALKVLITTNVLINMRENFF